MAPALPGGLVATVAAVSLLGSATPALLLLLLLLLLCSFFHRSSRRFSTLRRNEPPGLVRGVRMAQLGSSDAGAAPPAGIPIPGEPQQWVGGSEDHPDHPSKGHPELQVPGQTPHHPSHSEPTPRTPEFLRHRQLPVIPGNADASATDPVPDAEGRIYESIKYKPGTLEKLRDGGSTLGDPQSLSPGGDPDIPGPEEPGSERSPGPVYAWVCRMPRPRQPPRAPEPPQEEEEPPPLPEKHLDVE
ncbi:rna polymerase ii degradation factor 1-like [Willisornis vidua]|uniref:Rna polymerase ii degradation factor 1-like n=1 Tax=Willisornis vidua TaxID=1566151 RepID=A0ABQ9DV72_9PASS|nr:rna polymerase ii degradation factor 1-like [Willisornis vidua]